MLPKTLEEFYRLGKSLLLAIIISIIISVFILQPYTVVGSSMEPTLEGEDLHNQNKVGDKVMVFKSAYIFGNKPEYGDMVIIDSQVTKSRSLLDELLSNPILSIFSSEDNNKNIWIKRVIGEEGDTLEYKDGKVYRNGKLLKEDYTKEDIFTPFETVVVPEDHVFVMGDNRNDSSDSREIGPVPIDNVMGKVFIRFYPLNKIELINK